MRRFEVTFKLERSPSYCTKVIEAENEEAAQARAREMAIIDDLEWDRDCYSDECMVDTIEELTKEDEQ